jgi:hypothetical protein
MVERTRQAIGRRNRAKGAEAERDIVAYLIERGWPSELRREVRVGTARHGDAGDIRPGCGVVLEAKWHADRLTRMQVRTFLAKLSAEQLRPGELGILVERLPSVGAGRAGEWLTHWRLADLVAIGSGSGAPGLLGGAVACVDLATAVDLLTVAGMRPNPLSADLSADDVGLDTSPDDGMFSSLENNEPIAIGMFNSVGA